MRIITYLTALIAVTATGAVAQEQPDLWSGPYLGVNIGVASGGSSQVTDATFYRDDDVGTFENEFFSSESALDMMGALGGVQAGLNQRLGGVVVGIEADISRVGVSSSYTAASSYTETPEAIPADPTRKYVYNFDEAMNVTSTIDWSGSIRGRLGLTPTERLLVFGTGGLAYGHVSSSGGYQWREHGYWWGGPGDHDFDRSDAFTGSSDGIRWGWTIGAGLEYALTDRLSLKAEYLFTDLGSKSHTAINPDPESGESVTWNDSAKFHAVRLGLNYSF